ncbi:MAG TPA: hypothetical protein VJG49_03925, partial [Candidatus Nanoarchaeia archaeon]|nr:hypothetical protein [Candidatus Nanoarchaeia archaeon]
METIVLPDRESLLEGLVQRYVASFPGSVTEREYSRVAFDGNEFHVESAFFTLDFDFEDRIPLADIRSFKELSRERARRYVEESGFLSVSKKGRREYVDGFTFLFLYGHPDTRYATETDLAARDLLRISQQELEQLYEAGIINAISTSQWGYQPSMQDVREIYHRIWERLHNGVMKNETAALPLEQPETEGFEQNGPQPEPQTYFENGQPVQLSSGSVFKLVQEMMQDASLTPETVIPGLA